MEKEELLVVSLRYRAVYLNVNRKYICMDSEVSAPVLAFVARLKENGFCVTEELLHALCNVSVDTLLSITGVIDEVMGVRLNWAPLVKGWDVPTGESGEDHLMTFIVNLFADKDLKRGPVLPCGHQIPYGTFPIERYNGCPFCGAQFNLTGFVYTGQGSKLKELRLFTDEDMVGVYHSLLSSKTPLDATQKDSLQQLLAIYPVPENIKIDMKETVMLVIRALLLKGKSGQVSNFFNTPTDILRYLWFEKTGHLRIIEPKTLLRHAARARSSSIVAGKKKSLRLKYSRTTCRHVAAWLNSIPMSAAEAAEDMNPKRGMWVRMIHALRLGEYSRRKGYERLAEILDVFYKKEYTTWQGAIDKAADADAVLEMLEERPGLFARCLFSTMLRFGAEATIEAFNEISFKLPPRLLLSLGNVAESYFDPEQSRLARPITGGTYRIPANKYLSLYSKEDLDAMVRMVNGACKASMYGKMAEAATDAETIYIAPELYNIPISVGDRTVTIQDTACALMGTRFPVEGDSVRLFLQWGQGLPAQHLDMDLSCYICFDKERVTECAYYHLQCVGAKHSGDIRRIPEKVGTAEYIELNMPELLGAGAKYVTFTCNAYSDGVLNPNLVVGWMNSIYPMKISKETGVAYDPSCVQHMVRISNDNLAKGLVFGVLDVQKREIVWLEMPFMGMTVRNCDKASVELLLKRLENKLTIGELLDVKAEAQHLTIVDDPDKADEAYTYEWALNPAEVSLLLGV